MPASAPVQAVLPEDLPPHAIGMIWAQAESGVIGNDGDMPWRAPEDMAYYKASTWGHPVVMGRRTWESVPPRFRPFAGRTSIVLTRDTALAAAARSEGAHAVSTLHEALVEAQHAPGGELTWIVGGGSVYAAAMDRADVLSITVLDLDVAGDTHAPQPGEGFELFAASPADGGFHASEKGPAYRFETWVRRR